MILFLFWWSIFNLTLSFIGLIINRMQNSNLTLQVKESLGLVKKSDAHVALLFQKLQLNLFEIIWHLLRYTFLSIFLAIYLWS